MCPGDNWHEGTGNPDSPLHSLRRGSMKRKVCLLAAGGVLLAVVAILTIQVRSAAQTKTAEPEKQPAKPTADVQDAKHADDEAAIRKATADFIKAVEKGDAKAVASAWTEEGEYIGDDGTTLRGRAAI